VRAGNLVRGNQLRTHNDAKIAVKKSLTKRQLTTVHSLKLDRGDNYFVGRIGAMVHPVKD
jgi:hypothetical protein